MSGIPDFPGSNFVGSGDGFGLQFGITPEGRVEGRVLLGRDKQGPPGFAHGGAIAAVLDEAMTAAVYAAGLAGYTANLNVNFRQAIPVESEVQVVGQVEEVEGRKIFTSARILLPDGRLAAEGHGLFIHVEDLYQKLRQAAETQGKTPGTE